MRRIWMWSSLLMLCALCLIWAQQTARGTCMIDCYWANLTYAEGPNDKPVEIVESSLGATGWVDAHWDWNPNFDGDVTVTVRWYCRVVWWASGHLDEEVVPEFEFATKYYTARNWPGSTLSETAYFVQLLWEDVPEWADGIKVTMRVDMDLDDAQKPQGGCGIIMPGDSRGLGSDINTENW